MKKIKINISMLVVITALFLFSCIKPNNKPPIADTELESSVDAAWATFVVTDIEQITAFIGEGQQLTNFYRDIPGSNNAANATGSVALLAPPGQRVFGFNKTICYDGRSREGSVFWNYTYDPSYDKFVYKSNPNARYPHDNGLVARIALVDYTVDGWKVEINPAPHGLTNVVVANLMPENYNAKAGPIKWRILGDFIFNHPSDVSKNMKISVDLIKSLLNSDDERIYNQSSLGSNIKWSDFVPVSTSSTTSPKTASAAALVAYTGTISGTTSNGAKFRMVIDENHPLLRDFTCYADKIGRIVSLNNNGMQPIYNEFHPFSKGVASFTTGCTNSPDIDVPGKSELYQRQIYFGNEDNPGLDIQCDNSGSIQIKGISYSVDFRK